MDLRTPAFDEPTGTGRPPQAGARVGPALERVLDQLVSEGGAPAGLQVHAIAHGSSIVDVDTLGGGGGGSLVALHCAAKPLLALAAVAAHVEGRLDIDEPLARRHQAFAKADKTGLTTRHLLQHRACLTDFDAVPPAALRGRAALVNEILALPQIAGHPPGRRTHYSVVSNWVLLGEVLEHVIGEVPHLAVQGILKKLGVQDLFLQLRPETYGTEAHRLAPWRLKKGSETVDVVPNPAVCLLPLYGTSGYGTARSLAGFYNALMTTTDPIIAEAVRMMTTDPVRDRDLYSRVAASFGLGVSVNVRRSWFGDVFSVTSFGASGATAGTTGAADPTFQLALAVLFTDHETSLAAYARRRRIVEAIYTDLGLTASFPQTGRRALRPSP